MVVVLSAATLLVGGRVIYRPLLLSSVERGARRRSRASACASSACCSCSLWPSPSACRRSPSGRSSRRRCSSDRRPPRCACHPEPAHRDGGRLPPRGLDDLARHPLRLRQRPTGSRRSQGCPSASSSWPSCSSSTSLSGLPAFAGSRAGRYAGDRAALDAAAPAAGRRAAGARSDVLGLHDQCVGGRHHRGDRRRGGRLLRRAPRGRRSRRMPSPTAPSPAPPAPTSSASTRSSAWASSRCSPHSASGSLSRRGRADVATALALVMMLALGAAFLEPEHASTSPRSSRSSSARSSGVSSTQDPAGRRARPGLRRRRGTALSAAHAHLDRPRDCRGAGASIRIAIETGVSAWSWRAPPR